MTGQQISHDCGIEAMMFDRYIQFLLFLFATSALIITPTLGVFNYFVGPQDHTTNALERLSWSNLSPDRAGYYWLYALFAPCFVGYILVMISWELQKAVALRPNLQSCRYPPAAVPSDCFWVALTNIPAHMQGESELRSYYQLWNENIVLLSFIHDETRQDQLLAKRQALVRNLERREATFIFEMVRWHGRSHAQDFQQRLSTQLSQRRSSFVPLEMTHRRQGMWLARWLPYRIQPIHWLYLELLEVNKNLCHERDRSSKTPSRAALLGLNQDRAARTLASHSYSVDTPFFRAQYLGPTKSQIIPSNMHGSYLAVEARRECINLLTTTLVVLWSIPVGASGFTSQLSSAVRLLQNEYQLNFPTWFIGFFQGVLPQLATSILMSSFPPALRYLMTQKMYLTSREIQLSTQQFYFYFLSAQLFVNTSLSSGLVPTLLEVANSGITRIPRILAQNLPLANTYFLSYVSIQAASMAVSTFIRPASLFQLYLGRRYCRTPKDLIDAVYRLHYHVRWGEIYPLYSTIANIGECRPQICVG